MLGSLQTASNLKIRLDRSGFLTLTSLLVRGAMLAYILFVKTS